MRHGRVACGGECEAGDSKAIAPSSGAEFRRPDFSSALNPFDAGMGMPMALQGSENLRVAPGTPTDAEWVLMRRGQS